MEALYAKLYEKYSRLKTKKWSEVDEINREQEVKFMNYVSAADELIAHLRNENERLRVQVNDLTNEVASIRSTKHEQFTEYQRLSMEEKQKNKELLEEIERLRNLQREGLCCSVKDGRIENGQLNTSGGSQVGLEAFNGLTKSMTRKRSRHPGIETEVSVCPSASDQLENALVIGSANDLSKQTMPSGAPLNIHQPECCRRKIDSSGSGADVTVSANCVFQDLVECLVGMKLSTVIQADEICISALHQSTGYSFSLTWVNKSDGEETELLYRVLSLGTFERVAPEWMREVLMFSTGMCPVFFERISRIIKLHH
ncbi:uncharacterized protein LOC132311465 [Cornus florida]|uniref:uncharacterized protein LOC132311465 n=1 Tax=Cornus florida TaxID=4283 RepID=UPI00289CEA74|nr:uncharacterized protein LOC132311465 [Cornus florida]XP_059665353.1 uncharacterized protein LOC132311465 [Cornus florida]